MLRIEDEIKAFRESGESDYWFTWRGEKDYDINIWIYNGDIRVVAHQNNSRDLQVLHIEPYYIDA
jgi:hypothetical protein